MVLIKYSIQETYGYKLTLFTEKYNKSFKKTMNEHITVR